MATGHRHKSTRAPVWPFSIVQVNATHYESSTKTHVQHQSPPTCVEKRHRSQHQANKQPTLTPVCEHKLSWTPLRWIRLTANATHCESSTKTHVQHQSPPTCVEKRHRSQHQANKQPTLTPVCEHKLSWTPLRWIRLTATIHA
eukprot:TRINITY_DN56585_c0_g1_i1.p3 TRINITY_DN56585_c0_g1~~TRINITY_DN56585_c0_g1_i1.p3  ORF type:complete len:143 (+),score=15.65 TRINITY_DN56585_c0_g1_i1:113-541(+)